MIEIKPEYEEIVKYIKDINTKAILDVTSKFDISTNIANRLIMRAQKVCSRLFPVVSEQEGLEFIEKYSNGISSEEIAKEYVVAGSTVTNRLKKNGITIRSNSESKIKYIKNDDYFNEIDTPRKAYFLGLMYSDGNVHKINSWIKVALLESDKNVLQEFSNDIFGFEKIKYYESTHGSGTSKMAEFGFYSPKMDDDLAKHGCMYNKCFKIRIPSLSDELMLHFMRGYIDGDGCVYVNKTNTRIKVTFASNYEFCEDIKKYMKEKYNFNWSIYKKKNPGSGDLTLNKTEDIYKFMDMIYKDSDGLYIERKYKKFIDYKTLKENNGK